MATGRRTTKRSWKVSYPRGDYKMTLTVEPRSADVDPIGFEEYRSAMEELFIEPAIKQATKQARQKNRRARKSA